MVFGGNGNDKLKGGRGNDTIFGGGGKDRIEGGRGADILVGGTGSDKIRGGRGDDLIIAGFLKNDFDDLSIIDDIDAAVAAWATSNTADVFTHAGSVVDDEEKDKLFGEKGIDRIYAGRRDRSRQ